MTPNLIAQKYVDEFEKSYGEIALIDVMTKAVEEGVRQEQENICLLIMARGNKQNMYGAIDPKITVDAIRSREEGK